MILFLSVIFLNINLVTKDIHQLTHVFQIHPKNFGQKQLQIQSQKIDETDAKYIFPTKENQNFGLSFATLAFPVLDLSHLKLKALTEVGLQKKNPLFDYPVIPTSGYRNCLKKNWNANLPRKNETAYIGALHKICEGCVPLNMNHSFEQLSLEVCTSQKLKCGIGSGLSCGLLAFSTKTFISVDPIELKTWPKYMHDFDYSGRENHILENNHRLLFDRHTIHQSHPLLMNPSHRHQRGFNLICWAGGKYCKDKYHPIEIGNMGDIFPSHLAYWFATQNNLSYHTNCMNERTLKQPNKLTIALVGSIADTHKVLHTPNTILLGVGTISSNGLTVKGPKLRKDINVMGVRGPRTRDAFLLKYGVNPEVVGDPGLYIYELFQTQVKNTTSSTN